MKSEDIIIRVKSFMSERNLKQSDIVQMTGIRQSVISEMLHGKRKIYPLTDFIRKSFGIDILEDVNAEVSYKHGVPYFDVDFLGGFDLVANNQTTNPDYYINFKPFEKATCWCNVTGHSMEPEINHGDIIALRKIDDFSFLPYGEIYAIVTKNDMRTVKRLGPGSTPDTYTLIPANKSAEYAPQEISRESILFVYEVMGCMKKF